MIIGIDPGEKGAIAFIDPEGGQLTVFDMPIARYNGKKVLDAACVVEIFKRYPVEKAYLERVWASPQMGVTSVATFMEGKGILIGALAGLKIPLEQVTPAKWQKTMNCPAEPRLAVKRGAELFPDVAHLFYGPRGGPKDGPAEACMIALYGCLKERRVPSKPLELIRDAKNPEG